MAAKCPRTCCKNCRSSCKCVAGSTCPYSSTDKANWCYLEGGMMGKYCKDSIRSKSGNNKRYWSWRPCKNQACYVATTGVVGEYSNCKKGWAYYEGPAGEYCPGAHKSGTYDAYWSYDLCKTDCTCTDQYDTYPGRYSCKRLTWCYVKGGPAGRLCPGATKSAMGDYYWSEEPCKAVDTKVIGYWHKVHTYQREEFISREEEVTVEETSSRSSSMAQTELNQWSQQITESHDLEVAVEFSYKWLAAKGSLSSRYNYHNEKIQNSHFEQEFRNKASETFTRKKTSKSKVTIPKQDGSPNKFANVWTWRTEVVSRTKGGNNLPKEGGYFSAAREGKYVFTTTGCGYSMPPNCLPGYCQSNDSNCWTCERSWATINSTFVRPCDDRCAWKPVESGSCPSRSKCSTLTECTAFMGENQLCRAKTDFLPNGEPANIRNCYGRYDIFDYQCD